jgi:multidrug resistance protein MdtO
MARPAADPLARALENTPGRAAFALRLALACALTACVTAVYRTPEAALPIYLVFFINKPDRASSVVLAAAMAVLALLVVGLLLGLAKLVVDAVALRIASIAAVSVGMLYLASASRLKPVAGTIALVLAYGLDLLGRIPGGEAATRGLLYGLLFVAIPVGVSTLLALVLAPAPAQLLRRALAQRLQAAGAGLRAGRPSARLRQLLGEDPAELSRLLRLAELEAAAPRGELAALRAASASTLQVLACIDLMLRTPAALPGSTQRERCARGLDALAQALRDGACPRALDLELDLEAGTAQGLGAELLRTLQRRLGSFALAVPGEPARSAPGGFFSANAWTDPVHVRHALKTTAAAMFCYGLYTVLDWPGIHTCFITCYIVSLTSVAESVEKLLLRLAGCLVGALLGSAALLFVLPQISSLPAFLALIFCGLLPAAWLAAGSERIAYAGLQIAFAFLLCVVQGAGPGFDLGVARDRVVGILLGNLVAYLVATRIWPVSIQGQIDDGLARAWRGLAEFGAAASPADRRACADAVQGGAAAAQRGLGLVHFEPPQLRPAPGWLRTRGGAARALERIAPLLMLDQEAAPGLTALFARRASDLDVARRRAGATGGRSAVGGMEVAIETP